MVIKMIDNSNSESSIMIDNLKNLSDQRKNYAKYDDNVLNFKKTNTIEEFILINDFFYNKLITIIIICLIAAIILYYSK